MSTNMWYVCLWTIQNKNDAQFRASQPRMLDSVMSFVATAPKKLKLSVFSFAEDEQGPDFAQ